MSAPQLFRFGDIADELGGLVDKIENGPDEMNSKQLLNDLNSCLMGIRGAEKKIHSTIAKKSREINSIETRQLATPNDTSNSLIESAIVRHLLQLGLFDAAEALVKESPLLRGQEVLIQQHKQLESILKDIDNGDISSALNWANIHASFLTRAHSTLINDLHCLKLAHERKQGPIKALGYLRDSGSSVFSQNAKGIPLMLIQSMPQEYFTRARESFKWAFLCQIGASPVSQLEIASNAGLVALPQMARTYAVMRSRNAEWTSRDELPVAISLPEEHHFHPVFVCPVSKEQTSTSNPAQLLPCGHVLSQLTVHSLRNEGLSKRVIKCPYCPESATIDSLETIIFASE